MSEVFSSYSHRDPEKRKKPVVIKEVPPKTSDTAGLPLTPREFRKVEADLHEEANIHRRAELSKTVAEAEKAVGRRRELSKTAFAIAREQSTLAGAPERSVEDLVNRIAALYGNRGELSFFDFAGKRAVDEQIKRAEDQLIQAKEKRRHKARAIVAEKLGELSPIRELPDSAVKTLSPLEAELEAKQLELGTASAINPFNWPRRSRLQEEISVLKKKIAGERIAKAMEGRD